jgi:hypothetical protein
MVEEETEGFQKVRENVLQVERLILHVLDFDLQIRHPILYVKDLVRFFDRCRKRSDDDADFVEKRRLVEGDDQRLTEVGSQVYKTAIAMINDSYLTTLSLQYDTTVIAAGCVWLALQASTKNTGVFKLMKVKHWVRQLVTHLKDTADYHDPLVKYVVDGLKKEHVEDVRDQLLVYVHVQTHMSVKHVSGRAGFVELPQNVCVHVHRVQ